MKIYSEVFVFSYSLHWILHRSQRNYCIVSSVNFSSYWITALLSMLQMSNRARWSVMQSYNLLKWHKHAHRAAVKALESGHSLSVVIRRIEEAMSSTSWWLVLIVIISCYQSKVLLEAFPGMLTRLGCKQFLRWSFSYVLNTAGREHWVIFCCNFCAVSQLGHTSIGSILKNYRFFFHLNIKSWLAGACEDDRTDRTVDGEGPEQLF